MNNKPDEATLVSYLYGELDSVEQLKVHEYLRNNPEEKKRLEEWSSTRSMLHHLQDKEVIAPPVIAGADTVEVPLWKQRYIRMSLGIAASMLFFLVAARLLDLSASYAQGEFKIGFGTIKKTEQAAPVITEQRVNDMIHSSVARNNEVLQASWSDERKSLDQSIQKNLNSNSVKIDRLLQAASAANQEQVRKFVGQLQNDNLKLMKDYMQLSAEGQKQYVETLLVDFSKYLQGQRNNDLQLFQTRISSIETNTDLFKQETEQILTSLITNSGTTNQRRN